MSERMEASESEEGESEEEERESVEEERESVEEREEDEVQTKYTMCFYINEANQENTPVPTNPEVFIQDRPTLTVIAK